MTRYIYVLYFLISLPSLCSAQLPLFGPGYADSLGKVLQQETNDSVKAKLHFTLTIYWLARDSAKAAHHLAEGKRFSRHSPFMQGYAASQEGYFYYGTDMEKSEAAYRKTDSLMSRFATKDAYRVRANAWRNMAVIRQRQDDDEGYLDILLSKALPLAEQSGDSVLIGSQYTSIGLAFMNTEQYGKAEPYLNNAISYLQGGSDRTAMLVSAYYRAGENYIYLKNLQRVKVMLDSMRIILAPHPESDMNSGYYLVEGMYHHERKEYDKALNSFDKGIATAGGANKIYRIQELQYAKVRALLAQKSYEKARQVLTGLLKDEDAMSLVDNQIETYSRLSEAYAGLGNMPLAYTWLKRYSQLSDSMYESRLLHDINALEVKFRNAENQKEIIALKAANEQADLSSRNAWLMTWLLASACIFLLIVTVFALLYYRSHKKLSARKIAEAEQQKQLELTKAILEGEERERQRLARDLHDGLGGMLAGVKMNLSGTVEGLPGTVPGKARLIQIIQQLDNSVNELRGIARNMMPESLLNFGLETALKDMCELNTVPGLDIHFEALGVQPDLPEKTQIVIYRIAQELLANAIKHSGASKIILQCSQNQHMFYLAIEDNGKGFDPQMNKKAGLGWNNIRNRVDFLKGKMEVDSVPGEGTTINIELNVSE
ncbi:tetratricopeptide repeat-containing sensor histidine kinase [Chitinophaga cymbidii]|uniref:histidine kinase n=1 Tax=Chitinophaga cymbidii TaxID=1096750 RepID=A0A512RNU5_9BACT|nr:sensor histidine kinase [Chitinophaga cymbidii]GEP97357.1 hypothetical protein CCY01nite_36170 [Chitinophaga cymbidii]